ncbi:MAG: thermonuclease family protein, partial [Candidatus Fonsibacter sp.]
MKKIIIFFGLIFLVSATVSADTKKVKVIDGDTIHIGTVKYRFFGIDAPEIKQICEKNNKKIEC